MIETFKIIETIYYILSRLGRSADKISLVKLIYLADKYHLIKYGRTITNDEYFAMQHGPVGSTVKDLLSCDDDYLTTKENTYFNRLIKKSGQVSYTAQKLSRKPALDMLSDTDREAVDFIVEKFGGYSSWKLRNYTHRYPEWRQYRDLFESSRVKRERIDTKELLSTVDDVFGLPADHIKDSKHIVAGLI
jgi:uncharacterized phage-associated protein